jgi:hypothetical protein
LDGYFKNLRNITLTLHGIPYLLCILTYIAVSISACDRLKEHSVPIGKDGEGVVSVTGGPVRMSSVCTLTFEYQTGPSGIDTGGGIHFIVSPYWGWSRPQVSDPMQPGFVRMEHSTDAEISISSTRIDSIRLIVTRGRIEKDERITLIYGSLTGESGAALTDRFSESAQEFIFKSDADGDGQFAMINEQPVVNVLPGQPTQLLVTCNSECAVNEYCRVHVAVLDYNFNWVRDWQGTVIVTAGESFEPISRTTTYLGLEESHLEFKAVQSGISHFRVTAEGMKTGVPLLGRSNPVYVHPDKVKLRLYWGDIHGHSVLSDGTGTPEDYYLYGRDVSGLDFTALTDHDSWGFRPLLDVLPMYVSEGNRFNEPGRFTVLLGYEWTQWTDGHRNVYAPGSTLTVYSQSDSRYNTPSELSEALRSSGALIIPHHLGGGPIPFNLEYNDPELYRVAEIASVHGVSETYGNDRCIYNAVPNGFYRDALKRGYEWGIIASSDSHDGHPGLRTQGREVRGTVAVRAEELNRKSILAAIQNRQSYGSTGARIYIEFSINGHSMGSKIHLERETERSVTAMVIGEGDLERISLIKNGAVVKRFYGQDNLCHIQWIDSSPHSRKDWYYLKVRQMDGEEAFTSPIWIQCPNVSRK